MARGERTEQTRKMLEEAVEQLQTDDGWLAFLGGFRSFHRYSLNNRFLIALQRPDASYIKGFRSWQDLGRQVQPGSKAIWILAPRPFTKERDDGTEEQRMWFKSIPVFAYEDTDPIPDFPGHVWEAPVWESVTGDPELAEQLWHDLLAVAADRGWGFSQEERRTRARGSFHPDSRRIWVQDDGPRLDQLKTLMHEISHALTYDQLKKGEGFTSYDYSLGEAVAESTAFVVCNLFGIDSTITSSKYVALWEAERFRETAEMVNHTAGVIIEWLETAEQQRIAEVAA